MIASEVWLLPDRRAATLGRASGIDSSSWIALMASRNTQSLSSFRNSPAPVCLSRRKVATAATRTAAELWLLNAVNCSGYALPVRPMMAAWRM